MHITRGLGALAERTAAVGNGADRNVTERRRASGKPMTHGGRVLPLDAGSIHEIETSRRFGATQFGS
jgi:hypothetical protein